MGLGSSRVGQNGFVVGPIRPLATHWKNSCFFSAFQVRVMEGPPPTPRVCSTSFPEPLSLAVFSRRKHLEQRIVGESRVAAGSFRRSCVPETAAGDAREHVAGKRRSRRVRRRKRRFVRGEWNRGRRRPGPWKEIRSLRFRSWGLLGSRRLRIRRPCKFPRFGARRRGTRPGGGWAECGRGGR